MAAGPPEVLEKDLGCPAATDKLPGRAGKGRRKDADGPVSSDGESGGAHGLEEARAPLGVSEQDLDEPELSMPEPAPLGADKNAAEKKRVEKLGVKGSTAGSAVSKSLPVQRKVEPPGLDPTEEPLLWEGLTLNKCILVASVVALLSVTFQVLQAPCSREGVSPGRQDPPPPPLHEVVSAKEEEVQEVVTAQPAQPESSMFKGDDGDGDGDDDEDEADSNLAEPWIFKKWFGRSTLEDEDEEPADVPEVPPAVTEVKKSQEKKPEKTEKEEKLQKEEKEEKAWEKPEKEEKEDTPEEEEEEEKPEKEEKTREKKKKKEEKARERHAAQEWSSRREARAKDRVLGDKPGRALRAPREPEQPPQKKRGREGKERRRERDEPRREGWKGRPSRAEGGRESPTRDWRQHKGRRPWEPAATPGREGTARHREGKRRD